MSHILKDKIDLDVVKYFFSNLDINRLSKDFIEDILEEFLPRDACNQLLIGYDIKDRGMHPAIFYPNSCSISLSVSKIQKWLKNNCESLSEYYNITDINTFSKYLFFFLITHEVEHGYEFLMASDKVPSPCILVRDGYKGIFDLFDKKDTIIPRPIKEVRRSISLFLYKLHENLFVLERNANIESLDLICRLAKYMEDDIYYDAFTKMFYKFVKLGYLDNSEGSFSNTYKSILMSSKISSDIDFNIDFLERVRYGLSISNEEREKVLVLGKK